MARQPLPIHGVMWHPEREKANSHMNTWKLSFNGAEWKLHYSRSRSRSISLINVTSPNTQLGRWKSFDWLAARLPRDRQVKDIAVVTGYQSRSFHFNSDLLLQRSVVRK
jgi:hypothetical protein